MIKNIFWNPTENRFRVVWRVLLMLASYNALLWVLRILTPVGIHDRTPDLSAAAIDLLKLIVVLLAMFFAARFIDKRHFYDFGFKLREKIWWVDFVFGLILAIWLVTLVFGVEFVMDWLKFLGLFFHPENKSFIVAITPPVLSVLVTAIYTNIVFSSYLVMNFAEGFNFLKRYDKRLTVLAAWLVATLLYMLFRVGSVNLVLLSNLLRGSFLITLPFVLTRRLGLSIGLSLGWGFANGYLFSFSQQGIFTSNTVIIAFLQGGPVAITGGDLGPEGGLIGLAALSLGGALIIWWARRHQAPSTPEFDPWLFNYRPLDAGNETKVGEGV